MKKTILIIACILGASAVGFSQMCDSKAHASDTTYTIHYGNEELLNEVYE